MNTSASSGSVSLTPAASIRSLLKSKEEKRREMCLSIIENSRIFNFFGVTDITAEKIESVITDVLSIRDDRKIVLTALLLDRWFWCPETGVYVKHVQSGTRNILYQVILGNPMWDGVYELGLKGIDIEASGSVENGVRTLTLCSPGNYDVAEVRNGSGESVSLTRYEMGDGFSSRILSMGLVTEKEAETYSGKDSLTDQYLKRVLPAIKIC